MPRSPAPCKKNVDQTHPADGPDELLDVVDGLGRVVTRQPRSLCHGDPSLRHRAVHVLVRNRAGHIFLQKRARTKAVQPGKWDSSAGGHLLPGEGWEEAARRELKEELGIVAEGLVHLYDYEWRSEIETEHVGTYLLECEGPFRLHPDEIEEGRFWSVAELRAARHTGVLTPNLEEELRRLGVFEDACRRPRDMV